MEVGSVILAVLLTTLSLAQEPDAKAWFERGMAAFDRGEYAESIVAWEQAWALEQHPILIYDIGNSYEQLGEWAKAVEYLERYLPDAPPEEQAGLTARITELRAKIPPTPAPAPVAPQPQPEPAAVVPAPQPEPEPAPVAPVPQPEPAPVVPAPQPEPQPVAVQPEPVTIATADVPFPTGEPPSLVPAYALLGVGSAGLLAGGLARLAENSTSITLLEACPDETLCNDYARQLERTRRRQGSLGNASLALGTASVLAGAMWVANSEKTGAWASPLPGRGVSIGLSGAFGGP